MDLLKLLKEKAEYFSASEEDRGISSVVSHIEIAERHYEVGKSGDDFLFNDVIYRSNQAFEGALKEAYRIITGSDSIKITPYKIEKYFEQNNVLKERVLQLFTNYRMEWRNKSTHDYKLYFSEQEAFLAIVNISAFINILLDQMVEKKAYDKEVSDLKVKPAPKILKSKEKGLLERASELLESFSIEVPGKIKGAASPRVLEVEVIGSLTAFFNSVADDIDVFPEFSIIYDVDDNRKYYADFLLQQGKEKLIIEVKNPVHGAQGAIARGFEQLLSYLTASGVTQGILYIPPMRKEEELKISTQNTNIGGREYTIVLIYPEQKLNRTNSAVAKSRAAD